MRFSTQGLSLSADPLAGERELRQTLARQDVSATVLLEDPSGYPEEFYLVRVKQGSSTLAIGLCCNGQGPKPQVHVVDRDHLLLGFSQEVVMLRVSGGEILWQVALGALCWELIDLEAMNLVLVIHEIGALCLTPEGEVLWRYDKGVVEQFAIKRENLVLRFVEFPGVRLDLRTGERR